MPRWKAWVRRPCGLIKRDKCEAQAIIVTLHNCLLKVGNVLRPVLLK